MFAPYVVKIAPIGSHYQYVPFPNKKIYSYGISPSQESRLYLVRPENELLYSRMRIGRSTFALELLRDVDGVAPLEGARRAHHAVAPEPGHAPVAPGPAPAPGDVHGLHLVSVWGKKKGRAANNTITK